VAPRDQREQVRIARVVLGDLEAAVVTALDPQFADLETLATVIACSPIVVPRAVARRRLPAGFEDLDLAILDWIAAEGARARRSLVRM
jgi:hypothetical protein